MKKNKKKIIMLFICLIILIILIYEIIHIYAVFYTEATGTLDMKNAKWNVEVNGVNIVDDKIKEFLITEIEVDENSHVKKGNIAPGTNGFFMIKIDPKDTQVSVKYDITFDESKLKDSSIKIKSVTETQSGKSLVKTNENTYTNLFTLDDIQNGLVNYIKIQIEWLSEGENQEIDTSLASKADAKLEIPIIVQVTQYLGEEIVEYIE